MMNFYYTSMYDINNFYCFTSQYLLIKNNICINLNFFFLNFFLNDFYFLYENKNQFQIFYQENSSNYILDKYFYRINNNENTFWSKGYNWVREDINLEYSFNNSIQNGKPRFFNKKNIPEVNFTSLNNYWLMYSLYINNYYNIEDIFSTTIRPGIEPSYFYSSIEKMRDTNLIKSFFGKSKELPNYGFFTKEFNYYYLNTIVNLVYDYKRFYNYNDNFDFLYTSQFKRFFSDSNFLFSSILLDPSINEYMSLTYRQLDKQIKYYLFYELKPFEFGFDALKTYGYFIKDNLKLENGYKFELLNSLLFDLINETKVPSKFNYQSIIHQNSISNKNYFIDNEEFFVHMSDYKHLLYGLNRYYPAIKGKLIFSDYIYLEIQIPNLDEYKKRVELGLYNLYSLKENIYNYNFIKPSKYYFLDFDFFKKIINNIEYMERYNNFCNNLSYMDYRLNYSITTTADLTQVCYEQSKDKYLLGKLYNDPEFYRNKKIYSIFDQTAIPNYDQFMIPEGSTVFQDLGLPYKDIKRDNYFIPVKSYLAFRIEAQAAYLADIFFEAEEIFGDWELAHHFDDLVVEQHIVDSGLLQYKINSSFGDIFVKNYKSLDESFLELFFIDETDYEFFQEADSLMDKSDYEEIFYELINNDNFLDEYEMKFMNSFFETEAEDISEIEESNDALLEFYFK